MKILLLFTMAFSVACNNPKEHEASRIAEMAIHLPVKPPHNNYFEDIDIGKCEGVNRLQWLAFPCIGITDSADRRTIVLHENKKIKWELTFIKKAKYWYAYDAFRGDTSMVYMHDFIKDNERITVSYADTISSNVCDIQFTNEDSTCVCFPDTTFSSKKKSPLDAAALIRSNYKRCWVQKAIHENGMTKLLSYYIYPDGRVGAWHKRCYKKQQHSNTWWSYFSYSLKEEKCENDLR